MRCCAPPPPAYFLGATDRLTSNNPRFACCIMSLLSVVHDFRALYSTRVHQKDKRWVDGRLRYYEFNKKIEVLSEEGSLVMSDFYPQNAKPPLESGVFEDGNTYVLPGGKMVVEFSEYLGCTERDVSKVFSNKRAKEFGSPDTFIPIRHIAAPPKVLIKQEDSNLALTLNPVRRVGLARPKKQIKQRDLSSYIQPIKLTTEQKLAKYYRPYSKNPRIPPGSNKLTKRLHAALGIPLFET